VEAADAAASDLPSADDADPFEALPYLSLNLSRAPRSPLRSLFEVIDPRTQVHPDSDDVTMNITLPGDLVPDPAEVAEKIEEVMPHTQKPRHQDSTGGAVAVSTPNGIRTRATALKGRRPGPLDDEGLRAGRGGLAAHIGDPRSIWDPPGDRQNGFAGLAARREATAAGTMGACWR
jgi:site-specific DNA recombinase